MDPDGFILSCQRYEARETKEPKETKETTETKEETREEAREAQGGQCQDLVPACTIALVELCEVTYSADCFLDTSTSSNGVAALATGTWTETHTFAVLN